VSRDVLNRLVARTALGQLGDECVTIVVPPAFDRGIGTDFVPNRLEGGTGFCRVRGLRRTEREDVPFGEWSKNSNDQWPE